MTHKLSFHFETNMSVKAQFFAWGIRPYCPCNKVDNRDFVRSTHEFI